jgi:20S proteasome subunit beta 6
MITTAVKNNLSRTRRPHDCTMLTTRLTLFVWIVLFSSNTSTLASSSFEPYELNGGLVSAVAGKNFCILASDTRMFDSGGYNLASRHHLASRLWTVDDSPLMESVEDLLRTTHATNAQERATLLTERQAAVVGGGGISHSTTKKRIQPTIMIGSAGCSTDCEQLKRTMRADLRAARHFGNVLHSSSLLPDQVATLLSQVLYMRRGFPYYSFCVVAGLDPLNDDNNNNDNNNSNGKAFVYDAIGSYEQVAVAAAGTGREALQPILDGAFACHSAHQKYVEGTADEAIDTLYHAYQSVSEREIGVGDTLVLCVTERNAETNTVDCRVILVPLKEH